MEELNKKIAEWCGFRGRTTTDPDWYRPQVIAPGGQVIAMPDFTTSLDACFEYIVPKLPADRIVSFGNDWCEITNNGADDRGTLEIYGIGKAGTPALALCRAVEKLTDDEYDKSFRSKVVSQTEPINPIDE